MEQRDWGGFAHQAGEESGGDGEGKRQADWK